MSFARASGILLHPTSLPGKFGTGSLGEEAHRFADFLVSAGQRLWQVRLNDVPASVPMSYAVGGQEYIAIIAGAGNPHTLSYNQFVPEFKNPPGLGTTLWVFEVPAK